MSDLAIEPALPPGVKRLLIAGGSFDPPHRGHVRLAMDAADAARCDHVLFIPAQQSPLKCNVATPAEHRLAMLRLALANQPRTSISTIELDRPGRSYTIDTLRAFRDALAPAVELRLFIGSDQLRSFDAWRESNEVVRIARPVVVLRPPDTISSLQAAGVPPERLAWIVDVPLHDVSSTQVRDRVAGGADSTQLVEPSVLNYIRQHGLYPGGKP